MLCNREANPIAEAMVDRKRSHDNIFLDLTEGFHAEIDYSTPKSVL